MPLAVLMLPWPSFSVPFQTAEAVRCIWFSSGLRDFNSLRRIYCGRDMAFGLSARNCFTLATIRNPAFARGGSFRVCTKTCPLHPEKSGMKRPPHALEEPAVSPIRRLPQTFRLDVRLYVMDLD